MIDKSAPSVSSAVCRAIIWTDVVVIKLHIGQVAQPRDSVGGQRRTSKPNILLPFREQPCCSSARGWHRQLLRGMDACRITVPASVLQSCSLIWELRADLPRQVVIEKSSQNHNPAASYRVVTPHEGV